MKTETFPHNYNARARFPGMRMIKGFEGGAIYTAEQGDKFYVIIDEGTMADFIGEEDADLLSSLVKVLTFDDEAERTQYLQQHRLVKMSDKP